jgi:hypothetical protein
VPAPWRLPRGRVRALVTADPAGRALHPIRPANVCSIRFLRWGLARPGAGPADRGAAGAVCRAARRRPGNRPRAGRRRGTVRSRGRHQGLEPDAAGAAAPAGGVRHAAGRLPRPTTESHSRYVALGTRRRRYGAGFGGSTCRCRRCCRYAHRELDPSGQNHPPQLARTATDALLLEIEFSHMPAT